MASKNYNFSAPPPPSDQADEDDAQKSSLQKTIGNVLSLVNDGLYRIKNRTKSERLFDDDVESSELKEDR